jgi:hypothetical protein
LADSISKKVLEDFDKRMKTPLPESISKEEPPKNEKPPDEKATLNGDASLRHFL